MSRRNCSIAAAIAAASAGVAAECVSSIRGLGGECLPLRLTAPRLSSEAMPEIPVFDHDTVLQAVTPAEAIDRVRDAFVRHHDGEWVMPSKVYLDAPDGPGDFRAMPARGGGLAILKWVTSFPGNTANGLPVVMGLVCVSDAADGRPLALIDARAVTALRTGAVAGHAVRHVVMVGHSVGSAETWLEAARYHDIDALIVTGALHAISPDISALQNDLYPAADDPAFAGTGLDTGYLTTQPGTLRCPEASGQPIQ